MSMAFWGISYKCINPQQAPSKDRTEVTSAFPERKTAKISSPAITQGGDEIITDSNATIDVSSSPPMEDFFENKDDENLLSPTPQSGNDSTGTASVKDINTDSSPPTWIGPASMQWTFPTVSNTNLKATSSEPGEMNKRAIVLLSMGEDAAKSALVERIHVSIRKRGQFLGPVILITDTSPERYENLSKVDPNFVLLQPLPEDWNWELPRDMPYKRFKTYTLAYLNRDQRLNHVQILYYLDIDVVVGQTLMDWFHHVETNYLFAKGGNNNNPSKMVFFKGNFKFYPIQGGQFILQRNSSEKCLERWRYHMDVQPTQDKDQVSLAALSKEEDKICEISIMEQKPYLKFLSLNSMTNMLNETVRYATLMHIKNTQFATKIPDKKQKRFYQKLLNLTDAQASVMGKVRIRPNKEWSATSLQNQKQE